MLHYRLYQIAVNHEDAPTTFSKVSGTEKASPADFLVEDQGALKEAVDRAIRATLENDDLVGNAASCLSLRTKGSVLCFQEGKPRRGIVLGIGIGS
jgi:hypothetical protein